MSEVVRLTTNLVVFLIVWFGLEAIRKHFGTRASIIAAVVVVMACIIFLVCP